MTKRYVTLAIVYAVLAMACGVFFREFTKFSGFEGATNLSLMHGHYLTMGTLFFLLLALLEKSFGFSGGKRTGLFLVAYHVGLNITALGFLLRGIFAVRGTVLASGANAALSGVAGIGHIILGVSLLALLLKVRKRAA